MASASEDLPKKLLRASFPTSRAKIAYAFASRSRSSGSRKHFHALVWSRAIVSTSALLGDLREALDLPVHVPRGLAEVLDASLEPHAPEVLDRVPDVEVEVLRDRDALDPARVARVVARGVDRIVRLRRRHPRHPERPLCVGADLLPEL